jgi:membrane associated rhomboid family serine protease
VSQPDLFVVCKNCGSEVSPYVTECPYCGQRVRKRAPKIEKGVPTEERRQRRKVPSLPRLRKGELPGIMPETRPYATLALIVLSLAATVVNASGEVSLYDMGGIFFSIGDEWWRIFATPFLYDNAGYQFIALVAIGVFGTHLERRFGWFAVVAVFLLSGAAGAALSEVLEIYPALGGNGAALGLLAAWYVNDRMALRRGEDRGNDLLGVYVFAAVLLLLSPAADEASIAAALGGGAAGTLLGLTFTSFRR